jgi:hypothetical protein
VGLVDAMLWITSTSLSTTQSALLLLRWPEISFGTPPACDGFGKSCSGTKRMLRELGPFILHSTPSGHMTPRDRYVRVVVSSEDSILMHSDFAQTAQFLQNRFRTGSKMDFALQSEHRKTERGA